MEFDTSHALPLEMTPDTKFAESERDGVPPHEFRRRFKFHKVAANPTQRSRRSASELYRTNRESTKALVTRTVVLSLSGH